MWRRGESLPGLEQSLSRHIRYRNLNSAKLEVPNRPTVCITVFYVPNGRLFQLCVVVICGLLVGVPEAVSKPGSYADYGIGRIQAILDI